MNSPQKSKVKHIEFHASTSVLNKRADVDMRKEHRCPVCNRLLLKGKIIQIETRCPRCKKLCRISE